MFQRILLAWDGSDVALRAFDVAIDVTRRYDGELVAVSDRLLPRPRRDRRRPRANPPTPPAATSTRPSRRSPTAPSAPASTSSTRSSTATTPHRRCSHHAHEHGFDLIVCGHHHSRRAGRLLLHDVADDLFREASTPVLVVGENSRR